MKILLYLITALILIVLVFQAFVMKSTKETESYQYEVIKRYDAFEIRQYEAANFSYVTLDGNNYQETSGYGFRKLAAYIFGANSENQKIAMTSPVSMNFSEQTTMMFMIPSEYEMDELPKPNSQDVKFKSMPAKVMTAIRFGGWANNEKIESYTNKLKKLLQDEGLKYKGEFSYLGYNPPYEVVNRRNEIVVELEGYDLE